MIPEVLRLSRGVIKRSCFYNVNASIYSESQTVTALIKAAADRAGGHYPVYMDGVYAHLY